MWYFWQICEKSTLSSVDDILRGKCVNTRWVYGSASYIVIWWQLPTASISLYIFLLTIAYENSCIFLKGWKVKMIHGLLLLGLVVGGRDRLITTIRLIVNLCVLIRHIWLIVEEKVLRYDHVWDWTISFFRAWKGISVYNAYLIVLHSCILSYAWNSE